MADKKPLRISDDPNDLQSVEFGATDSLGISDGGTSATTANDALNNLLPSQTGNSGKQLQTDGSNTSWAEPAEPVVLSPAAYAALRFNGSFNYDLTSDVWAKFTSWNSEIESGGTVINADQTTDRITVGADGEGTYLVTFSLEFESGTAGELSAVIYKNGIILAPCQVTIGGSNGQIDHLSGTCMEDMVDGDYFELWIRSNATNQDPTISNAILAVAKTSGGAKGIAGADGADGDITWEGDWVSQNYTANQAVSYLGSSYVCHTSTTSNQVPTDVSFWDVLAEKGDQGIQGIQGIQGDTGPQGIQGIQGIQGETGPQGPEGNNAVAYLLNFGDKTGPGISTTSATYSAQGIFSYHGTSVTLGKSTAKAASGTTGQIRFYNVTAANVVMESATFSNVSYATIDFGTVTNQPSEGDIIEVQYKRATGSGGSAIGMASATMFVDL